MNAKEGKLKTESLSKLRCIIIKLLKISKVKRPESSQRGEPHLQNPSSSSGLRHRRGQWGHFPRAERGEVGLAKKILQEFRGNKDTFRRKKKKKKENLLLVDPCLKNECHQGREF